MLPVPLEVSVRRSSVVTSPLSVMEPEVAPLVMSMSPPASVVSRDPFSGSTPSTRTSPSPSSPAEIVINVLATTGALAVMSSSATNVALPVTFRGPNTLMSSAATNSRPAVALLVAEMVIAEDSVMVTAEPANWTDPKLTVAEASPSVMLAPVRRAREATARVAPVSSVMAPAETRSRPSAVLEPTSWVAESSVMSTSPLTAENVRLPKLTVSVASSPRVMSPALAASVVLSAEIADPATSVMLPVADVTVSPPELPASTVSRETSPVVVTRLMSLLAESVRDRTSVAVSSPSASIVIEPSAVVTLVSVTASVSSMSMAPVPVTDAVIESVSVSRSIPVAAVASRFVLAMLVVAALPSVIDPAASRTTSLPVAVMAPASISPAEAVRLTLPVAPPAVTRLAVMVPPASTVIVPSLVLASTSVIALVSSMSMFPAVVLAMSRLPTVVSRLIVVAASAVS